MKSFSNMYIFLFSTAMVTIVAVLLSFVSEQLRPIQEKNVEVEKKLDILRSVGEADSLNEVKKKDKDTYIEEEYHKNITNSFVISSSGELKKDMDAFAVDMKVELDKPEEERNLPIFVYTAEDSTIKYIFPLRGTGLWGPIWGYIALYDDYNTIYGAIFKHSKETPGLGAEINESWFQEQFENKTIFDENGNFVSVEVVKGGAKPDDPHAVDAISGGTITSKGLENMLKVCLGNYVQYLKTIKDNQNE
jgi:Na+-transporting NADH:ubiquinone oxidoreductase subunit C